MEKIEIKEYINLPFGENLGQNAAISPVENGLEYEVLSDTDNLEYVDYLNLAKVVEIIAEFFDVNAAALAKENQLCSAALGSNIKTALDKVTECNAIALINGTLGFSKEVTEEIAKDLKSMQVRNIIATGFQKEALDYLLKNSDINIVKIKSPLQELLGFSAKEVRLTPFGYLVQDKNQSKLTKSSFKVAGKTKPTQQLAEDAIFAWKIAKYTTSKSAVIAKDLATKAIVQGFSDNIEPVERAMDFACENSKDAVLAVDGVIENEEIINAAIQGRIGLIIEAGDGKNSAKTVKLADKYNIALIKTGLRNNRY